MDESEADQLAILRAENRLLRAALEGQRKFRHDLSCCPCKGCVETRGLLQVRPVTTPILARDAGPTPFAGRKTDRSRT